MAYFQDQATGQKGTCITWAKTLQRISAFFKCLYHIEDESFGSSTNGVPLKYDRTYKQRGQTFCLELTLTSRIARQKTE